MTALIHPQLPLGFEPGELFTFDSFVAGKNSVAVGLARQMAASGYSNAAKSEQQLYIWGEPGLGKSHLLQASCNLAAKNRHTVCYLTHDEIHNQTTDIFDGLEQIELVCLDDIETWLVEPHWELALFDLINRMREKGNCLMLASSHSPDEDFVKLPDLRSRLAWGPVFHLQDISDKEKYQALSFRARQSGLELPENVADYLMKRYPRDMFGLFERLSVLDKASMAMQRRLTIPLVKSVFSDEL
ncbi:MAG: DnaA regulatory inactivator Hda [Gammaproteobacteria bacterium]|nr:DnaA regulatory inactivator Hda [Gammaproteobacteria bacterium]MBT8133651.1 DnaA regulatory inactivator Hda [Gammaproteobacteria bacterium]NNJ49914.1 DnaA regulatory inactivator Hda [Gammaproteobacteria bacterium]